MPNNLPTTIPASTPNVEKIERFQALEPGAYWRAKIKIETLDVEQGLVLLLLDVQDYDGKPHTVVLRYHPLDGEGEYRMLVQDFLVSFEPAPNGEEVRAREMAAVQKEITDLQNELLEGQRNPALLAEDIEKGLRELVEKPAGGRKKAEQQEAIEKAVTLPWHLHADLGTVLSNQPTKGSVQALRQLAEREAKIAEVKAEWITGRTELIAEKLGALAPFFAEKSAVALARTRAVRQYAEDIIKGLASLDLYIGKGVEVETVAEGKVAPASEKLAVMQRKLFVDEEVSAWADVSADFDVSDLDTFDKLLKSNASLRDQIFSTQRCVVSMAVRRRDLNYGDLWTSYQMNQANKRVFLMIRNGENIYRVYSAQPTHEFSKRLFPTTDEFNQLFCGIDGEKITFRDVRFTEKSAKSDDLALHYKRFLVLLAGLDHRLTLFGEFYDRSEATRFISKAFQKRYFQFIADDERSRLLGENRPDVFAWAKEKNAYLQSGSRVLCYYPHLLNSKTAPSCFTYSSYNNSARAVASPTVDHEVRIAYRDGSEICVDVEVQRESAEWRDLARPKFNARVSLAKAGDGDCAFDFPFLCLDAVQPEELEFYVHSRENRTHHVDFMRIFKITAAHLRQERQTERPSREYLRQALLEASLTDSGAVDKIIEDSVRAWRCANRGKPLTSVDDKTALDPLLNHLYSRLRRGGDYAQRIEAFVTQNHHVPLKAVLTGKNRLALYVEVPPAERDETLLPWRWVRLLSLGLQKNGLSENSDRLVWLREGMADAKETEIMRWPALDGWINEGPEPLSPSLLPKALEIIRSGVPRVAETFIREGHGIPEDMFNNLLAQLRQQLRSSRSRYVPDVTLSVPVGAYVSQEYAGGALAFLVVREEAHSWLYHFGNKEQRERVAQVFIGMFKNRDAAQKRLRSRFAPDLRVRSGLPRDTFEITTKPPHYVPRHLHDAKYYRKDGFTSVERRLNNTLNAWVRLCLEDNDESRSSPPRRFVLNPLIWNGQRSHLERYFSGRASHKR